MHKQKGWICTQTIFAKLLYEMEKGRDTVLATIVLGIRLQPEPLVPCLNCDCHDPDMGCTMPSIDKSLRLPFGKL